MPTLQQTVSSMCGQNAWVLLSQEPEAMNVRRAIGCKVMFSEEIISDRAFDQLKMLTATAAFAESDQECVDVARMIHWIFRQPDVLPMISQHSGFDLLSRCLISISLFRKALERRLQRRGAPSPSFYREIGIITAKQEGMTLVAQHFDNWSGFIGETLGG